MATQLSLGGNIEIFIHVYILCSYVFILNTVNVVDVFLTVFKIYFIPVL